MQVAVWTIGFRCPSAWLCDTEEEAASFALHFDDDDSAVVLGVQFENGKLIESGDFDRWEAYRDLVEGRKRQRRVSQPVEPRKRTIRSPFADETGARSMASVPESYPEWVGAR